MSNNRNLYTKQLGYLKCYSDKRNGQVCSLVKMKWHMSKKILTTVDISVTLNLFVALKRIIMIRRLYQAAGEKKMGQEQRLGTAMTAAALQQHLSLSLGQYFLLFHLILYYPYHNQALSSQCILLSNIQA